MLFPILALFAMMFVSCTPEAEKDIAVTGVSLDKNEGAVTVDRTLTLEATVTPADATNQKVTWSSSDTTVATVVEGVVTGVKAGTATITVETEDGGFSDECTIEVLAETINVTDISVDPTEATLDEGTTLQLTSTVLPRDATNPAVAWTSDNEDVATVDADGLVNAIAAGTATITVTTEDGGLTADCILTVEIPIVPVTGVVLDKPEAMIAPIETLTLKATVQPENATNQKISWSSDNEEVATVDGNGLITPVADGTANITVTTEDGGKEAICALTVNLIGTTSFRTDKTWEVGTQIWSDAVMATGAKKEDYNGGSMGTYYPDCRKNEGFGDAFSWKAVEQFKDILCPDGWSVPTADDFHRLDMALNNRADYTTRNGDMDALSNYLSDEKWGGMLAGRAHNGVINNTAYAYYWAQDSRTATYANAFVLQDTGRIDPNNSSEMTFGFQVRCVKNE